MVLYQHILVAMPKFPAEGLVDMCKRLTKIIINAGGNVRSIENNGVRPLAERTKRQFPSMDGQRYFFEARYITVTYDAHPKVLTETDRLLKSEEALIRSFVVKQRSAFDLARGVTYRNQYRDDIKNDPRKPNPAALI